MKEHLEYTTTERGFDHMPELPGIYGGTVKVYESSSAMQPCVWLSATVPANRDKPDGASFETTVHLSAEDAWKLADQLRALVRNHYHGDAVPEWAEGT